MGKKPKVGIKRVHEKRTKAELLAITEDKIEALVLFFFLVRDKEISGADVNFDGWITKKENDLICDCLLLCSRRKLRESIERLIMYGFLESRENEDFRWCNAFDYRVIKENISVALEEKGLKLDDISLVW